jgi:predicted nucleotidyltransferase
MLQIANDFIESFNIPVVVSDIIMTGSLANYNWSEFSDIDIHIIVDFDQFEDDKKEVYEELFYLKKSIYNKNHNITIYSFDVELYVENEQEIKDVKSIGKFSILSNEWIEEPSKEKVDIDYNRIQQKSKKWMKGIDILIDTIEDEDYDTATKLIDKYNNKLRKYRVSGLKSDGEYSDENLVFKTLRRNGYLEKLRNLKNELSDKYLTLKETQRIK